MWGFLIGSRRCSSGLKNVGRSKPQCTHSFERAIVTSVQFGHVVSVGVSKSWGIRAPFQNGQLSSVTAMFGASVVRMKMRSCSQ